MKLTAFLQRLQFLGTLSKKVGKLGANFMALPKVVRVGGAVALVLVLTAYVWIQTKSLVDVALLLGIVALVGALLWLIGFAVRRREESLSATFDEQLQGTEMLEELRGQWARATGELQKAGVDRYNMSFYMLIGEPQSGKTTTLQKSGLNFPIGMDKIQGIGGTRNLDWWFTDEAVILDTAGRLTFQEERTSDAEEWSEFLGLLSRYRPKCPVNGVIVTIPCTSLLDDDAQTRERKAGVIRKALVEVERGLGVQFPVWVLLTKADRVGGFAEFFGRLRALEQTQLFGWSRPKQRFGEPFDAAEIDGAFASIVARLRKWRVLLLDQYEGEMQPDERDRMVPFPEEFAALQAPLASYLEQIFPSSRLLEPLFFRGFYVTSGVQKGEPILKAAARVLGGASGSERTIARLGARTERAYFIRDFYRKKVFAERGLVVPTAARTRKVTLIKRVGYGAATAAAVLGTAWVGVRWARMRGDVVEPVEKVEALAGTYRSHAEGGNAPAEVLTRLEALIELPSPAPIGGDLVAAAAGVVPEILRGDLLGTRGFLRVGGAQQQALHAGLVRTLRVGLVDGVVAPLAAGAVARLEALDDPRAIEVGRGDAVRAKRRGIESFVSMLLERDRPASVPPPASLRGFLDLAEVGVSGDVRLAERADDVYGFLADAHRAAYDDDLRGRGEAWRGLGLSAGLEHVGDRLRFALSKSIDSLRTDAFALAAPTGRPADWFEPALVPERRPSGAFLDEKGVAERLRAEGDDAARLAGYLYLRAAAIATGTNEALADMASIEEEIGVARGASGVEAVLAERADAWRSAADRVLVGLTELDSIVRVLPDGGLTASVDEAITAALASTNAAHARSLALARTVDSSRLPWVRETLEASVEGKPDGADWIGLEDGPIAGARLALGGRTPLDWKDAAGEVLPWHPIVSVEASGSDDAPRWRIVAAADTSRLAERVAAMRAAFLAESDRTQTLVDLGVFEVLEDDATRLVRTAWRADGPGPLATYAASLVAPAKPSTDPYGASAERARAALARVLVGRALTDVGARLEADGLADAPADAAAEPAAVRADRLAPDDARTGLALDKTFAEFVLPLALDARTASAAVGVASGGDAPLRAALDGVALAHLADWERYWSATFVKPLSDGVRAVADEGDRSWRRTTRSALALFGASDARTFGARTSALAERVRTSMLQDGAFLPRVPATGIEGLPRTTARIGAIRDLAAAAGGGGLSASALQDFAEVLTDERLDFGVESGAMWRAELRDEARRNRVISAFRPLVLAADEALVPVPVDGPPMELFTAVDEQYRALARHVRDVMGGALRVALVEDYERLRRSDAAEGFPFRDWDGAPASFPTDRDLRDLVGDVSSLVSMYRPLGLLPRPGAPAPRASAGLGEVFRGVAPAPESIQKAIADLEDVVELARGGDDDGVRLRVRLLPPRDTSDPIYLNIVRLSVSTGTGSWAGDAGERIQHLWRDEKNDKTVVLSTAAPSLALRFSRDPVGVGTAFEPDESYSFVRATPDGATADPILRYQGPLALLALIGEAQAVAQTQIEPDFDAAEGERKAETTVELPLVVRFDPGRSESGLEFDDTGTVRVEIVVEGHRVPPLPLVLPEWR